MLKRTAFQVETVRERRIGESKKGAKWEGEMRPVEDQFIKRSGEAEKITIFHVGCLPATMPLGVVLPETGTVASHKNAHDWSIVFSPRLK